jgi:hypothetical protein
MSSKSKYSALIWAETKKFVVGCKFVVGSINSDCLVEPGCNCLVGNGELVEGCNCLVADGFCVNEGAGATNDSSSMSDAKCPNRMFPNRMLPNKRMALMLIIIDTIMVAAISIGNIVIVLDDGKNRDIESDIVFSLAVAFDAKESDDDDDNNGGGLIAHFRLRFRRKQPPPNSDFVPPNSERMFPM